jgi:hypothetical protein
MVVALLLLIGAGPAARQPSIAVLQLAARNVEPELASLVGEALLQEVHKLDGRRVVGLAEIRELIGFERQRQLAGCTESECLAEIAGALGVDEVLSGSLGRLGDSWLLNLRRQNFHTSATIAQASSRIVGGRGEEFLDAVGPLVEQLYPGVGLKPGVTRGAAPTLRAKASALTRTGVSKKWAYSTGIAAVVLVGTGAAFGLSSHFAQNDFDSLNRKAATEPVPVEQVTSAYDRARKHALYANVFLGIGAATALASVLLFAFLEPDAPALAVMPSGVAVAGRF